MPSNFIFVESVQKVIKKGETEIKIQKGTKISPAAFDLIKENQIKVIYEEKPTVKAENKKEPSPDKVEKNTGQYQETKAGESKAAELKTQATQAAVCKKNVAEMLESMPNISETDVEQITLMVIERINALKNCTHDEAGDQTPGDSDDDMIICRCEEITKKEIKAVIRNGIRTLNGIKRITRSGMGLCQGQTCQLLVTRILAQELGIHPSELEPTTARAPVRPVRLSVFAG